MINEVRTKKTCQDTRIHQTMCPGISVCSLSLPILVITTCHPAVVEHLNRVVSNKKEDENKEKNIPRNQDMSINMMSWHHCLLFFIMVSSCYCSTLHCPIRLQLTHLDSRYITHHHMGSLLDSAGLHYIKVYFI